MPEASPAASPSGRGRKLLFGVLTLLTPLLFAAALEGAVRLLIYTPLVDDPYLNIGAVPSFFDKTTVDGRRYHRVSHDAAYRDRGILFPVEKDPGSVRIFCLGGSASAGWPHPKQEIYTAHLQQALQAAFPERELEVINVSAHAYASYRVRLIFESVLDFDPDALVIYSGNNEFLEPRTYMDREARAVRFAAALNRSATYRLGVHLVGRLRNPAASLDGGDRENIQYDMWSKIARVTRQLREDPVQLERVKEHYAFNIESMVTDAEARGVPVVLVTVPVNLRDWLPNVSRHGVSGAAYEAWRSAYDAGRAALLQGDADAALRALQRAVQLDPVHAESHYHLARAQEGVGAYATALESYIRANDLDHNPFRAISDFNASLEAIADRHANARVAPVAEAFLRESAPYAPGFDLLLDYVHPTRRGNLLVARTVFDALVASGVFGELGEAPAFRHVPQPIDETGELYDARSDYFLQRQLLGLFGMMHQYESLVAKAEEYAGVEDFEPEKIRKILSVFRPYLELRRTLLLGGSVPPEEVERIKTGVRDYYGDAYEIADMPSLTIDIF